MLLSEQEIRRAFLKEIKLAKTKPHKQGTLNRARMLEHHIQHRTRCQDVGTTYPTSYMSILKVRKTQEGGVELCSQKLFRSLR